MLFRESDLQIIFTLLDLPKQYKLHDYYGTDYELDDATFAVYRKAKDAAGPSLVNRAGKSFRVVERAFIEASQAHGMTKLHMKQAITTHNARHEVSPPGRPTSARSGQSASTDAVKVLPIGRPLDERKLAKTLLALARHMQANKLTLGEVELRQVAASSSSDPSRTSSRAG